MYRIKRARSVIHSLAHHGVSALSWLHPRLGEECKDSGVLEVTFDLVEGKITTKDFKASKETLCAYNALKATFEKILISESIHTGEIQSASINFGFKNSSHPYFCICTMAGFHSETINVKVDLMGEKFNLLSECRSYS